MRFVSASDLKPGMIVGNTLYSNTLSILLRRNVALTEAHIRSIRRMSVPGIYIEDKLTKNILIEPMLNEETKIAFASEVKSLFTSVKPHLIPAKSTMGDILRSIIEQISSKSKHIVNIFELKCFDGYTFQHSIDVCVLSIVMGVKMRFPHARLYNLALAAVYHDIGKMYINQNIINKQGPLTAEELTLIRQHPVLGAEHVKKLKIYHSSVLAGVQQHHEHFDGTGYPDALRGPYTHIFGKIIAIADVFDAITSERSYKNAMLPSDAVEYIMSNAGRHFDFDLARTFINCVEAYPTGLTVRLSNGMKGIVSENFEGFTLRPRVLILPDVPNAHPVNLNLKDDPEAQSITIVEILG